MRNIVSLGAVAAGCVASSQAAGQVTNASLLISGLWSNAANWSTSPVVPNNGQPVPADAYAVTIDNKIATLDQDVTITDLFLGHASGITNVLNDSGGVGRTLTVERQFDYAQGIITGGNTYVVGPGATMNFLTTPAGQTKQLNAELVNKGIVNINLFNALQSTAPGTRLINDSGGEINITAQANFIRSAGVTDSKLINRPGGVINQASTVTTTINWTLENDGVVNINSGSLSANNGGTHNGTFNIAQNRTMTFGGSGLTHILGPGSAVTGAGTVTFNTATTVQTTQENFTVANMIVNGNVFFQGTPEQFQAACDAELGSGKLEGGSFTANSVVWRGGEIKSPLTINQGGLLNGLVTPNTLSERTLTGTLTNNGLANVRGLYRTDNTQGPATFINNGAFKTSNTTTLNGSGTLVNHGMLEVSGNTTMNWTYVPKPGSVTLVKQNAVADFRALGLSQAAAEFCAGIEVEPGAVATFTAIDLDIINMKQGNVVINGSLEAEGKDIFFNDGILLAGGGFIKLPPFSEPELPGTATVDGTIKPGNSPGTLTFEGNLVLVAGTILDMELGAAGTTDADRIVVTAALTLDGTVNVIAFPGFGAGTYTLIQYSGALIDAGLSVGTMPAGFVGVVDLATAGEVRLIVNAAPPTCPGDANSDGVVNFADITAVLTAFNSTTTPFGFGDANGDGAVNFADITAVLTSFNTSCA